jgi:hypothetical protein
MSEEQARTSITCLAVYLSAEILRLVTRLRSLRGYSPRPAKGPRSSITVLKRTNESKLDLQL